MSQEKVKDVLDNGENNATGIGGILASLLYRIYHNAGINASSWHQLVTRFIKKQNERKINAAVSRRTLSVGNLRIQIFSGRMSWLNFWRGLCLLNPVKIEIGARIELRSGKVVSAHLEVDAAAIDDLLDRLDEE